MRHTLDARVHSSDHPTKLQHCRIVRDENGTVLGACQLQLPGKNPQVKPKRAAKANLSTAIEGDVGNLALLEWERHITSPKEAYVEMIAVDPSATGRG